MTDQFKPLPWDFQRCAPYPFAADKCKTCSRWAYHPEQTWGPRTPFSADNPGTCGVEEPK